MIKVAKLKFIYSFFIYDVTLAIKKLFKKFSFAEIALCPCRFVNSTILVFLNESINFLL